MVLRHLNADIQHWDKKQDCQSSHLKARSAEMDSVVQRWEPTRGLERFCPPLRQSRCSWRTIEVMAGIKIYQPQLTTEPLFKTADA